MPHALTMTTCDNRDAAEALADSIVAGGFGACVQISEITSVYRWEGKANRDREFLLMIKGTKERFAALRDHILAHHSYDVPEIVQLDIVDGNPAYLAWLGS